MSALQNPEDEREAQQLAARICRRTELPEHYCKGAECNSPGDDGRPWTGCIYLIMARMTVELSRKTGLPIRDDF